MASRRPPDSASAYIADAWRDAKRAQPSLTMGEFARRTFPPLVEQRRGEMRAWEERQGARLLGRIIRGDAPTEARQLLDASFIDVANIEYRNEKGYVSYSNWLMPPGTSTFDAFRLQHSDAARWAGRMIARGRVRDSAPFGGDPTGRGQVTAVRPIKIEQRRPYVGEFRVPDVGNPFRRQS